MSKTRMIDTKFWDDTYVSELDPIEKLLFLYFLTNPATNICGIYELPLKNVALDTGIEKEMVQKIVARFSKENKVHYIDGWVVIKNFVKHQNQKSPTVKKGIEIEMSKVPAVILEKSYGMDTLSHLNLNSNLNSNLNLNPKEATVPIAVVKKTNPVFSSLGAEVIKAFEEVDPKNKTYYANKTQRASADYLIEEFGLEQVLERISILPRTNSLAYFPSINSPNDLKEKWQKLIDAISREGNKQITGGRGIA